MPIVGRAPGAVVVRSDVIRKQLMGVEEAVRLSLDAYAQAINQKVYARLMELVGQTLNAGYCAIADAVFGMEEEREGFSRAELA